MRALASTTSSLQARNSSAELLTLTSAWEIGGTKCGKATHNEKSDSSRILYRQQTFYFCEKKSSFMYWSKERRRRIRRTTLLQTREFLFLGQKYQSKNHDEARQDFSQKNDILLQSSAWSPLLFSLVSLHFNYRINWCSTRQSST